MFPYTLDGPAFLLFYGLLLVAVWLALRLAKGRLGPQAAAPDLLQRLGRDPYAIACLRSGPSEAARVAVVSLVDRGALASTEAGQVTLTDEGRRLTAEAPIERAVLQACRSGPQAADELPYDEGVQAMAQALDDDLQRQGLVVSPALRSTRSRLCGAAALLLLAVSAVRIVQTLMAGHSNLGFLIALTVLGVVVVWIMAQGRLTAAGVRLLTDLQGLLGDLRKRAGSLQPGRSSRDVALLAGAFGLAVLPAAAFAFAGQLYPTPRGDGGSSGSDSGSSSSSDGGGDGGGGGGCGGGSSE
jgi:uncharacterized protein (TIGR04222 family)